MADSVSFATTENGTLSSGFNGLPFPVPFFDQYGNPFLEWDGETFFTSSFTDPYTNISHLDYQHSAPSGSSDEYIPVFGGPNYMGPFSLEQLVELQWRAKTFKSVMSGGASASVIFGPYWGWVGGGLPPSGTKTLGVTLSPPVTSPGSLPPATRELELCVSWVTPWFGGNFTKTATGSFNQFMFTQTIPGPVFPQFDGGGNYIGDTYGPDIYQNIYISGGADGSMSGGFAFSGGVIGVMESGNTDIGAASYYVEIQSAGGCGASLVWSVETTSGWGSLGGSWSAASPPSWNYNCDVIRAERDTRWGAGKWEQATDFVVTFELSSGSWTKSFPVFQATSEFYYTSSGILTVSKSFTPGILTVSPSEYWPYKNSDGDPVWDTDTGEQIAPIS